MGLSLEFYAGDADSIGAAFSEVEFEGLRNGTLAHSYADLSLHLSPTDLDILSEQIGALLRQPSILLLDSLERTVGGTEGESSADVVAHLPGICNTQWSESRARHGVGGGVTRIVCCDSTRS